MNKKYSELFETAREVFRDECKADMTVGEDYGTKLFPHMRRVRRRGRESYTLYFNERVEVVLSLYDIAVIRDINIGAALSYYILFYECISLDEYDHAREFLNSFTEELERLRIEEVMKETRHETNSFRRYQVLFTLFHEISHEFYRRLDNCHVTATATSKKILQSLKGPYTEVFTEENFAEAMKRKDVTNFILSQIPEGSSEEEMTRIVNEQVALYFYLTDLATYIDRLLNGDDKQFLDEISCDRYAFMIFMRWIEKRHIPSDKSSLLHDILYVAVNAMDNVKVLQTYCNPPRGAKDMPYDPRQIVLRQRALITNNLVLQGKKYQEESDYYTELNTTLEELMTTALNTMRTHEKLICEILERREKVKAVDSGIIHELQNAMESAVSSLVKDHDTPCPLDDIPMSASDFMDTESLWQLVKRYVRVKLTGRYAK